MCIVGIICGLSAEVPLVVVHSRDEFMDRPVLGPFVEGDVIYTQDVQEGGTWCGYNKRTGVFVALTNVRVKVPKPEGAVSRGLLVMDVLHGRLPFAAIEGASGAGGSPCVVPGVDLPSLLPSLDLGRVYAPFNLIVARAGGGGEGQAPEVFWLTNMGAEVQPPHLPARASSFVSLTPLPPTSASVVRLSAGVHALSNSVLNDACWAKVEWTRVGLEGVRAGLPKLAELDARYRDGGSAHHPAVAAAEGGGGGSAGAPPSSPPLPPHSLHTHAAEVALLEELLKGVVPVLTHTSPVGVGCATPSDLAWSPLPLGVEARLQERVFIPPSALGGGGEYGTRSLTLFAALGSHAYYTHRSFDPCDPVVLRADPSSKGEEGEGEQGTPAGLATAERHAAEVEADRLARRVHPQARGGGVCSTTTGVLHDSLAQAEALAVAEAVEGSAGSDSGVGVAVELVRTGQAGCGAERSGADGSVTVAGLEWTVFRCDLLREGSVQ